MLINIILLLSGLGIVPVLAYGSSYVHFKEMLSDTGPEGPSLF